jgi:hypothetical protein
MKQYTFKNGEQTTIISAHNVISAWHQFCEQVCGYVTSHTVIPVDFTAAHKRWEVREFKTRPTSVVETTVYISAPR